MAEGKKSFKLYTDQKIFFDQLPDELAGRMIKHLFAYVTDADPNEDDLLLKLAFAPIKRQLRFDLKKYEAVVERNTLNGKKGGRPKKPNGLNGFQNKPKKADKDKDKDKDKEGNIKRGRSIEEAKKVTVLEISIWVKQSNYPDKCPTWLHNKLQQFIEQGWKDGNGLQIKSTWKAKLRGQLNYAPKKADPTQSDYPEFKRLS